MHFAAETYVKWQRSQRQKRHSIHRNRVRRADKRACRKLLMHQKQTISCVNWRFWVLVSMAQIRFNVCTFNANGKFNSEVLWINDAFQIGAGAVASVCVCVIWNNIGTPTTCIHSKCAILNDFPLCDESSNKYCLCIRIQFSYSSIRHTTVHFEWRQTRT